MDGTDDFELNDAIDKWGKSNLSDTETVPADRQEIITHILISINELIDVGLDEEEAFVVATMRYGTRKDWGEEMQTLNEDNFKLKKIVLAFSGFIVYIFSYNLILCVSLLILLISVKANNEIANTLGNVQTYFNVVYALTVSGFVALYFMHQPVKWFLEKLKINIWYTLLMITALIVVIGLERYLVPAVNMSIDDQILMSSFFSSQKYFEYIFTSIVTIGYVVLFAVYLKKYYK